MALFFKKIGTALQASNAVTEEVGPVEAGNISDLTFYMVGSAGIASGACQPEESAISGYAGNWAPIGSPVTVPADTQKTTKASGATYIARVRVSTVFVNGTVDVYVMGIK